MGRLDDVVGLDVASVAIFRELGDRQGEADAADDLAVSYRAVGRCEGALAAHHQAIAIARDLAGIGDRFGEVRARRDLGEALHALGDRAGARRCWQAALAMCEALRVPEADQLRARLSALSADNERDLLVSGETPSRR